MQVYTHIMMQNSMHTNLCSVNFHFFFFRFLPARGCRPPRPRRSTNCRSAATGPAAAAAAAAAAGCFTTAGRYDDSSGRTASDGATIPRVKTVGEPEHYYTRAHGDGCTGNARGFADG